MRYFRLSIALFLICLSFIAVTPTQAVTFPTIACGDVAGLITTINLANASVGVADTIVLTPGCTYSIVTPTTTSDALPVIIDPLTIDGGGTLPNGVGGAVIQRDGTATDPFRIINVDNTDLTLTGVIIRDGSIFEPLPMGFGSDIDGAGVLVVDGTLTVNNSAFINNVNLAQFGSGGGVAVSFSPVPVVIQNTLFEDNIAYDLGGGLYVDGPAPEVQVDNSQFITNQVSSDGEAGGGIFVTSDGGDVVVTVNNTTFDDNRAPSGGGIGTQSDNSTITVTGSTFTANDAFDTNDFGRGGAIYSSGGGASPTMTITDSTFTNNTAGLYGGAIFTRAVDGGPSVTITGSSLTENESLLDGGAVYMQSDVFVILSIRDSTLALNDAVRGAGGAINLEGDFLDVTGEVTIVNSTLSGNTATGGGALNASVSGSALETTLRIASSTITGNSPSVWGLENSTVRMRNSILAGNTLVEPNFSVGTTYISEGYNLFGVGETPPGLTLVTGDRTTSNVMLHINPLADNGGGNGSTHALTTTGAAAESPFETANPAGCLDFSGNPITTDQRGQPRPSGAGCDMGAYETQIVPPVVIVPSATSTPAPVEVAAEPAYGAFIIKAVDKTIVQVGETVIYTINFNNPKPITLNNVVVADTFDSRLSNITVVSSSVGTSVVNGNTVTVQGFSLQPGQRATLVISARISAAARPGDVIPNTATLESPDASIHVSNVVTVTILPQALPATGASPLSNLRWMLLAGLLLSIGGGITWGIRQSKA